MTERDPTTAMPGRPVFRSFLIVGLSLATALAAVADRWALAGPAEDADAFVARVTATWASRDLGRWMALWESPTPEAGAAEADAARAAFGADQTVLTSLRAPSLSADGRRLTADMQVFVAEEPQGRVRYWRLAAEKRADRWLLVRRQDTGQVDGLVHLTLAPAAWRARGVSLQLEDFELRMDEGTLYATPEDLGPTALVFVGRGRVLFHPRPQAEREQLRQFSKKTALDTAVGWAFARINPADFDRVIETARLRPEPDPQARRAEAERVFRSRSPRSFMLDAPLPRSPWWLLPGAGDAVVDFPAGRKRVLTYALATGEAEDVNLFDRDRRLQICVYPSAGRPVHSGEDEPRSVEVLDQDLTVRFEPDRLDLSAVHSMRVRSLAGPTLRLRLDDRFSVSSVSTGDGTRLLFFRVREQNGLVVPLGGLAGEAEPITLVTRYSGRHDPAPVDQELLQIAAFRETDADETLVDKPPLVYSNRTFWYPRPSSETFAPASVGFDTPEGWLAVTGGELLDLRTEARRTRTRFRLEQPGKFMTAVVGRFSELGLRQEGEQSVRGYATPRSRGEAVSQMPLLQEMLAFYAERFGPCPYPAIGLAVVEGATPSGHSPPGLVYLQQRPLMMRTRLPDDPANFSDLPGFFLAHEAAHQWWGQGTAPASYRDRWLSEAWAQYAAALWVRHRLGEDAFRTMMDRMARWAVRGDDAGPIDLGQRLGNLKGEPRIFRAVVYDKGAWVIHMLRGTLGDTAFFDGVRAFLQGHRFAKAGSEDLRAALEQASGRDLQPYFERWIYDTGLPVILWTARSEPAAGGFLTTIEVRTQTLPGPVPLEIALDDAGGHETHRVTLGPAGGSWGFVTRDRPRRVALNEDRGLLLARLERVSRLPERPQR